MSVADLRRVACDEGRFESDRIECVRELANRANRAIGFVRTGGPLYGAERRELLRILQGAP